MVKTKRKNSSSAVLDRDAVFLFKCVLFLILGSQWLYIVQGEYRTLFPIPIGAIIGIAFIIKDRQQVDRKIEYALLLAAMFICFWLPLGMTLHI